MRLLRIVVLIAMIASSVSAQERPDFSGVWVLDASRSHRGEYGQVRVITQASDEIKLTVIHRGGVAGWYANYATRPWRLRINRWGPRRGSENSDRVLVQSRWDGEKLITL